MRIKFIECKWRYQALKEYPWASKIAKVCGGYMCFESEQDYKVWRMQK